MAVKTFLTNEDKQVFDEKFELLSEEMVKTVNGIAPDANGNVRIDINAEPVDPIGRVSGQAVFIADAVPEKPISLKVYGRTVQNGTPSEENPVAFPVKGNMRLNICGKNLVNVLQTTFVTGGTVEKMAGSAMVIPGRTYTFSATVTKANSQTGRVFLRCYDSANKNVAEKGQNVPGDGKLSLTFTAPDNFKTLYIMFMYGTEGDTATVTNVQLELGEAVTSYEPFSMADIISWNTSNLFNGIPVESGGNYTDADGQQWVSDVMDYTNNVYTRNTGYISSYAGESIPGVYLSTTGALTTGASIIYALEEPVVSTVPHPGMGSYNDWVMSSSYAAFCSHGNDWVYVEYNRQIDIDDDPVIEDHGFDPDLYNMNTLWLYGSLAGSSKENAVDLTYRYKDREGTASVKLQGSTSLYFPKKNYTIKFDTAFEVVEGWGEQSKYCFKANYIDHSHARNVVSAKLWGQVVKSRATVPAQLANLPNGGAIDGIVCAIMLNDKFYGLYTWNIPKDGWMYGMGEGDREAILCAEGTTDAKGFASTITELDGEYSYEYSKDENDTGWIVDSLNRLITAVLNSDGTDLDTTVAQYLDWDSAIDSYIFSTLISGHDNVVRNYLLVTFDGVKWYFGQYDMDEVFGQRGSGLYFRTSYDYPTFATSADLHKVYNLIKTYKKDALKARYKELRNGVLSEMNVCGTFANFIKTIPPHALMADLERYPTIPSAEMSNYAQIAHFYSLWVKHVDAEIEAL